MDKMSYMILGGAITIGVGYYLIKKGNMTICLNSANNTIRLSKNGIEKVDPVSEIEEFTDKAEESLGMDDEEIRPDL